MTNSFDKSLYNDEFYEWHVQHAKDYSIKTMNWFIQEYKPGSVVDFGCGIGSYLESSLSNGIKKIKGYDIGIHHAIKYASPEIVPYLEEKNCTLAIECGKYDCVISIETAEHVDPDRSEFLIENICNALSDNGMVLFTAAPPGQDGCGHINCQPKQYWIGLFNYKGLIQDSIATERIAKKWKELGAPDYIVNNLMVLIKA